MRRLLQLGFLVFAVTLVPSIGRSSGPPPCNAWEVEYNLAGRMRLSDTMFGAANGVHDIGPGRLVLRFDDVGGQPGGNVNVASYELSSQFTVDASVLGFRTVVVNETKTRATPDHRGVIAPGQIGEDRLIRWSGPWSGLETDGRLNCSGMCGRFGAPPHGWSRLHMGPHAVMFKPFTFAPNRSTFQMNYVVVDKTSVDTASLALSGRETQRRCLCVPPCP